MKDDLSILIDALHKEYSFLEKEMNACVEGWDFVNAESYKQGLIHTKAQLRILRNLENPCFSNSH